MGIPIILTAEVLGDFTGEDSVLIMVHIPTSTRIGIDQPFSGRLSTSFPIVHSLFRNVPDPTSRDGFSTGHPTPHQTRGGLFFGSTKGERMSDGEREGENPEGEIDG